MMADHATWVSLMADELSALQSILTHGVSPTDPNRQKLLDRIVQYTSPHTKDQRFRDAAESLDFVREGECEIDDHAVVSASDEGAYVMAWVWVENDLAGVTSHSPDCPAAESEGLACECDGDPDWVPEDEDT